MNDLRVTALPNKLYMSILFGCNVWHQRVQGRLFSAQLPCGLGAWYRADVILKRACGVYHLPLTFVLSINNLLVASTALIASNVQLKIVLAMPDVGTGCIAEIAADLQQDIRPL